MPREPNDDAPEDPMEIDDVVQSQNSSSEGDLHAMERESSDSDNSSSSSSDDECDSDPPWGPAPTAMIVRPRGRPRTRPLGPRRRPGRPRNFARPINTATPRPVRIDDETRQEATLQQQAEAEMEAYDAAERFRALQAGAEAAMERMAAEHEERLDAEDLRLTLNLQSEVFSHDDEADAVDHYAQQQAEAAMVDYDAMPLPMEICDMPPAPPRNNATTTDDNGVSSNQAQSDQNNNPLMHRSTLHSPTACAATHSNNVLPLISSITSGAITNRVPTDAQTPLDMAPNYGNAAEWLRNSARVLHEHRLRREQRDVQREAQVANTEVPHSVQQPYASRTSSSARSQRRRRRQRTLYCAEPASQHRIPSENVLPTATGLRPTIQVQPQENGVDESTEMTDISTLPTVGRRRQRSERSSESESSEARALQPSTTRRRFGDINPRENVMSTGDTVTINQECENVVSSDETMSPT